MNVWQGVMLALFSQSALALDGLVYGGDGWEEVRSLTADQRGVVYVTGYSSSLQLPGLSDQLGPGGGRDVLVAALDFNNRQVPFAVRLGSSGRDESWDIAISPNGHLWVVGTTDSSDWPSVESKIGPTGKSDVFLAELDSAGRLLKVILIGGSAEEVGRGVVADVEGNLYLTGSTASADFPTYEGLALTKPLGVGLDGFIMKLSSTGKLVYATYLGGRDWDEGYDIAVDRLGNAYVTGYTFSDDFPTVSPLFDFAGGGVYVAGYLFNEDCIPDQPMRGFAGADAFVSKLAPDGKRLMFSTYFSSRGDDWGNALAVDDQGSVYLVGETDFKEVGESRFPLYRAIQDYAGSGDAFVAKLAGSGEVVYYSTYLGGQGYDAAYAVAPDGAGGAYVAGSTFSLDFPKAVDYRDQAEGFLVHFASDGNLESSLLLGTEQDEWLQSIAVTREAIYLGGFSSFGEKRDLVLARLPVSSN